MYYSESSINAIINRVILHSIDTDGQNCILSCQKDISWTPVLTFKIRHTTDRAFQGKLTPQGGYGISK